MSEEERRARVGPSDYEVIDGQLGRSPRNLTGVAVRCPFGCPAVIETAPILDDGSPNPTLLYITCPTLVAAVSAVEARGGVRAFKSWVQEDSSARWAVERITVAYRNRRAQLAGERGLEARLEAGIGGPRESARASCLHAYAAAWLAVMSGWLVTPEEPAPVESASRLWAHVLPAVEDVWCRDQRCVFRRRGEAAADMRPMAGVERRAAIDVGTISVRLLVADVTGNEVRTVVRKAEVTRLGEGLRSGGGLSSEARERTAVVVARYVQEALSHGAERIVVVGTSATREASDGSEYVRHLGHQSRVISMVLSGQEEAEAAFAGASIDVSNDAVVLDIGGGSTELIRRVGGEVKSVSLELGASRATERWVKRDPPAREEVDAVYDEAAFLLGRMRLQFGNNVLRGVSIGGALLGSAANTSDCSAPHLVGVAGTVTTLACLDAGLSQYDSAAIHLRILTVSSVRRWVAQLSKMTIAERAELPCMQPGRASVIVSGAIVLLAAMDTLGYAELTVSERDLLDGLVLRWAC